MICGIVAEANENPPVSAPTSGSGSVLDPWVIELNTQIDGVTNDSKSADHYYTFETTEAGYITPYGLRTGSDGTTWNNIYIYKDEVSQANFIYQQTLSSESFTSEGKVGLRPGKYIIYARMHECTNYSLFIKFTPSNFYEEEIDSPTTPKKITSGELYYGQTSNYYGDEADYYYFTLDSGSKVTVSGKADWNYYMGIGIYGDDTYSSSIESASGDQPSFTKKLGAGTYYIKVTNGLSATANQGYQFRVVITPDPLEDFVRRMYQVVLGRDPDDVGLRDWVNRLESGQAEAVDIVEGFLLSPEYQGRQKSNSEIVTDAYNAMLGRTPDDSGFNYWRTALDSGMTTKAIIAGFVGSDEFIALCNQYEIRPGTYAVTEARDVNIGITEFVSRLYTQALGRSYDVSGLNNWCEELNTNPSRPNILTVSTSGFFHSQEFLNKNLNNEEFVKVLYRTFLGREYDEAGLANWVGQLDRGEKNRDQVMEGFAYSTEFGNIMAQYGL